MYNNFFCLKCIENRDFIDDKIFLDFMFVFVKKLIFWNSKIIYIKYIILFIIYIILVNLFLRLHKFMFF